ncbi:PucR family transcriptional regulator [Streptomyces ovatisporus]|uniref:PucR family transcriptional regulator n=1 Tax=Streptomyces ovatisporus TaxID=1128682 RepID=A0ABV9A448_9ACTN
MAAFQPVTRHQKCCDSPPRAHAVRRLQHDAAGLARQVLDEHHLPASAAHLAVSDVAEDVALWLSVLAGDITGTDAARRFRRRGRSHCGRRVPLEDAVLLQHVCARLIDGAGIGAPQGEFTRVLAMATTAIAAGYRDVRLESSAPVDEFEQTVKTLSGVSSHGTGTVELPADVATPLRWCLATVRLPDARPALGRFRAANPHALAAVADSRVICYSRERPTVPGGFPAHGLARVDDDAAHAARHAMASAGLAHHYGLDQVKVQQILPIIGALEQDPARREAFIDACLGPLRTSDRHRHLLDTLRAYLAHGLRTTPAARSLYVHRHTFTYRLRSIRRLTGLDLAHPLHRLRAELALLLLSVQRGAEAGRGLGG